VRVCEVWLCLRNQVDLPHRHGSPPYARGAPGVRMRRRSPPTNSAVALLPRLTVRPSRLRSRFTPRSASLPPASPGGATARRSDKMLTVSGLSISICRMAPHGRWVMVAEQGDCLAGSSVL